MWAQLELLAGSGTPDADSYQWDTYSRKTQRSEQVKAALGPQFWQAFFQRPAFSGASPSGSCLSIFSSLFSYLSPCGPDACHGQLLGLSGPERKTCTAWRQWV